MKAWLKSALKSAALALLALVEKKVEDKIRK